MSLQIWLPLNGDLHNQGLALLPAPTVNSFTFSEGGKIGKSTSGTGKIAWHLTEDILENKWSVATWIKPTATFGSANNIIFCKNTSTSNDCQIYFSIVNGTSLHLGVNGPSDSISCSYTFTVGVWYHVAATYDGSTAALYINGEQKKTGTVTTAHPGAKLNMQLRDRSNNAAGTGSGAFAQAAYAFNDFRLYNHALSPKEVEEIAKGLVLHYKLDEPVQLAENLMPNHLTMGYGSANASTGTWRNAGTSNMTKSRVQINDSPEGFCYGFQNEGIQTANDGSCYGIDGFPLQGNTTYTISMWARIINGTEGYAGYNIYNISAELGGSHSKIDKNYRVTTLPSDGSWIKCWYTFTTNASNTRNIYIGITTGNTTVTTQMCCVHIEKINKTALNIIYDSSGYNNNGTIVGSLTVAAPSPRYNVATQFNGTSSYIEAEPLPSETVTISAWVKFKTLPGGYKIILHDKFTSLAIGLTSTYRLITYVGSTNGGTGSQAQLPTLLTDTWYHIVVIKTGETTREVYFNGEQITNLGKNYWGGDLDKFTIGGRHISGAYSNFFDGQISDVRVYTTALNSIQIKELYNTSMIVDSNNNIRARGLNEL